MSYTHIPISKVRRNSSTDITDWHEQLTSTAYRKIEEWEKLHGFSHSCHSSCSYCCKHPILVLELEAFIISKYLFNNALQDFIKKAADTTKHIKEVLPPPPPSTNEKLVQNYREQYFKTNILCPFHHDNKCVIYPVRPTNCVTYFSYGNPQDCLVNGSPQLGVQFNAVEFWMMQELFNFYNYNKKAFPANLLTRETTLLPFAIQDFGS